MADDKKAYDVSVILRMFEILQAAGKAHEFADSCKGKFQFVMDQDFVAAARKAMDDVVPELIARRPGYMSDVLGTDARAALEKRRQDVVAYTSGGTCWACP